jgi:hypothetical protein
VNRERWKTIQSTTTQHQLALLKTTWLTLSRIVDELPSKRDWLDPDLEHIAREITGIENPDTRPVPKNGLGRI